MHMYFLFLFFQVVKIPLVYEPLVVLKSTNFFEFKFIIKCSLFTSFWFLYKLIFIWALIVYTFANQKVKKNYNVITITLYTANALLRTAVTKVPTLK